MRLRFFSLMYSAVLLLTLSGNAQVVINELMADNKSALYHAGKYPDYIELYNPGLDAVSVAGWSLSDDAALPQKYVLPPGAVVPGQGWLVIWADSEYALPGFHTGFGLGSGGERLALYGPMATLVDEIVFGIQAADFSVGRIPDGAPAWTLCNASAGTGNTAATLGNPASLRFNEWMASPVAGEDWLEVFNSALLPIALGGLVITDATPANRAVPPLSYIAPSGFCLFWASDLAKNDADHLDFKLSASGETLRLYAENRLTLLEQAVFGTQTTGVSQGRAPDGSSTIVFFPAGMATPGASNFSEITNVVISEVLAHSDPPFEDAIELQNISAGPVEISHWWLSDSSSDPRKYRIPAPTVLAPGEFRVFYDIQFGSGAGGFSLNAAVGDQVILSTGDAAGNLTGSQAIVKFGASKRFASFGRYATSLGVDFVPMTAPTFGVSDPGSILEFRSGTGASNSLPRQSAVVINEIMYSPAGVDEEYLELHNPAAVPVNLYDPLAATNRWQLADGIAFTFPAGVALPPYGYLLVVGFDPALSLTRLAAFRTRHSVPAGIPVYGPYAGALNDSGEALVLLEPDEPEGLNSDNPGFVPYPQSERIKYLPSYPWPTTAVQTGYSIQRSNPESYGNEPLNWTGAVPTPGRVNKPDRDYDGMPDAWEASSSLNADSAADAGLDADLDGVSNLKEYLTGTNPRDGSSALKITRLVPEPGGVRIQFHAVQQRIYTVELCNSLSIPAWTGIATTPTVGATGLLEMSCSVASGKERYFRVMTPAKP